MVYGHQNVNHSLFPVDLNTMGTLAILWGLNNVSRYIHDKQYMHFYKLTSQRANAVDQQTIQQESFQWLAQLAVLSPHRQLCFLCFCSHGVKLGTFVIGVTLNIEVIESMIYTNF